MTYSQLGACLLLVAAPALLGQEEAETARRITYGFRVEAFPLKLFATKSTTGSTTSPIADYTYTGGSNSQKLGPGLSVEYRWNRHLAVGAEFFLHHAHYWQISEVRTGKKDTTSSADDRPVTTYTENTKANYWEVPVLARYYGIRNSGLLSHAYAVGGFEFRHVGRIRTGTDIVNADGTTDYNEVAAKASRLNQFGVVAGAGMRFVDAFGIKVMPEIRYIRWQGYSFLGPSYSSVQNQAEIGLGFSF